MTSGTTSEPIRLLEQADVSEGERSLLEAGRSCAPVDYDVTAGAARFRTQLAALAAAGALAGTAGSNAGAGGKALLAKLAFKIALGFTMAAAFAGAGLVAGMHLAATSSHGAVVHAPPRVEAPSPVVPPIGASPFPAPSPSADAVPPRSSTARSAAAEDAPVRRAPSHPVAQEPHRGALAPARGAPGASASFPSHDDPAGGVVDAPAATANVAPPVEAPTASVAPAPPPAPSAKPIPPPSQSLSEIRAVALARDLVDTDPQAALALLDQTQREHPTGYFVEERQALTVMALVRAGRQATARQQGAAFLRAYPNGPFSDRVRSVTGL
jgi:hypothetical protein